jgi:hypothetical protein
MKRPADQLPYGSMYEEPEESPSGRVLDPKSRAKEKAEEFRMYAELGAVFEGTRKFDAGVVPLDAGLAREIQKGIGKLEKAKQPGSPVLPPEAMADGAKLLDLLDDRGLPPNHYRVYRRPGEVMIARWIEGELVEGFYDRMQAHFDVGLGAYKEEEQQTHGWKQDQRTTAYLAALDAVELRPAEAYLREPIRKHNLFVLSTVTTDEMNIAWLSEDVMGMPPGELLGEASAPGDEPTESDLAWFFKLFSLRGMKEGQERMLFFAYLQKSDDTAW